MGQHWLDRRSARHAKRDRRITHSRACVRSAPTSVRRAPQSRPLGPARVRNSPLAHLNSQAIAVGFGASLTGGIPMARATARHILVASEAKCNELKAAIEGGA